MEAANQAVDAVLSAEVSCSCLDAYKRMSKPDPSCSYHAIAWNGGVEMLARAALAVVPPDPRLAQIQEDAVWLAKLASGSSWPGEMAHRVQTAADRVIAACGSDADRAIARLLAGGGE